MEIVKKDTHINNKSKKHYMPCFLNKISLINLKGMWNVLNSSLNMHKK